MSHTGQNPLAHEPSKTCEHCGLIEKEHPFYDDDGETKFGDCKRFIPKKPINQSAWSKMTKTQKKSIDKLINTPKNHSPQGGFDSFTTGVASEGTFNLSEKELRAYTGYTNLKGIGERYGFAGYKKEDVKEFIRRYGQILVKKYAEEKVIHKNYRVCALLSELRMELHKLAGDELR